MSMSTSLIGFCSPENENYKKHSKILIACIEAGVSELPKETTEFFGSKYPYKDLLEEKLQTEIPIPMHEYSNDSSVAYEIILSEIPKEVHTIRLVHTFLC